MLLCSLLNELFIFSWQFCKENKIFLRRLAIFVTQVSLNANYFPMSHNVPVFIPGVCRNFTWQRRGNTKGHLSHISIAGPRDVVTNVATTFLLWGVRLNLSEFTWLVSCSIVTSHYLFQYLKAMFFGYLNGVGNRRASLVIKIFECARHSLTSSGYCTA